MRARVIERHLLWGCEGETPFRHVAISMGNLSLRIFLKNIIISFITLYHICHLLNLQLKQRVVVYMPVCIPTDKVEKGLNYNNSVCRVCVVMYVVYNNP